MAVHHVALGRDADLVDVTERAVWMHEEMEQAVGSAPSAPC
jgi:hypothetical protein